MFFCCVGISIGCLIYEGLLDDTAHADVDERLQRKK